MIAPTPEPSRGNDWIEEHMQLSQSPARVWRALTDPAELGAWFGIDLAGAVIAPGKTIAGNFTIAGHEHLRFTATVDEVVPPTRFSWRWHPGAVDPNADYSAEPTTLVTFTLEPTADGGTLLRVVESGFSMLPESRRASTLEGNAGGWKIQLTQRLPEYLTQA